MDTSNGGVGTPEEPIPNDNGSTEIGGRSGHAGIAALRAAALGALAVGAVALSAVTIGALLIGTLRIGKAKIREVAIDELRVKRLWIGDREVMAGDVDGTAS